MPGDPVRVLRRVVSRFLSAHGVGSGDAVGVGCSGGPDSMALADAAIALSGGPRARLGSVTLIHVAHGLRPDADADADAVRALAAAARVDVEVVPVAVDRAVAARRGLAWVLLAHTASDQAETVLMRIVRGTGVAGLAAIPARRGRYLRPLLTVSRGAIDAYVAARGLAVAADPMNADPRFLRARIRHRWLPALGGENPRLERALNRLAASAREQRQVLEWAADRLLARAALPASSTSRESASRRSPGALDTRALAAAPDAVAKRALARAAEAAGGEPLGARHQDALLALVRRPIGGTVSASLPGQVAVREYDALWFAPRGVDVAAAADTAGKDLAVSLAVSGPAPPYRVRRWRPGDRMRPARLRGRSRKLSDLFIDAKVPRRLRATARVVVRVADGVIEWAEHIGAAHGSDVEVRLTPGDPVASNKVSDKQ